MEQIEEAWSAGSHFALCLAGTAALAVAMGVGRFAFTPLLPLMVQDGLLPGDAGAWLAASNYLGYLLGALTARALFLPPAVLMRASLFGIVLVTAWMGKTGSEAVWAALRCAAGLFSAWALVGTSAWVLPRLVQAGRPGHAGIVYAGVGLGIALVGIFCILIAGPGVSSAGLWLKMGGVAALASLLALFGPAKPASAPRQETAPPVAGEGSPALFGLVVAYGCFGFGYILPATYLPAMARRMIADPGLFGLAWPAFGLAGMLSTLAVSWMLKTGSRLKVWAIGHLLMAIGTVLPSLWLSPVSVALAALLVGGTFMAVTMVGFQEARARVSGDPTAILGAMTAAFALGQLAGPMLSVAIGRFVAGPSSALNLSLQLGGLGLALSAVYLWRQSR